MRLAATAEPQRSERSERMMRGGRVLGWGEGRCRSRRKRVRVREKKVANWACEEGMP